MDNEKIETKRVDNDRDNNKFKDNIKVETKTKAKNTTTMKILPQKV